MCVVCIYVLYVCNCKTYVLGVCVKKELTVLTFHVNHCHVNYYLLNCPVIY
uniref:Uncharacterized protein n=2 Tax=unclassified Caudoviricetes TaxID=2788787 RepID=A0A8S5UMW7_9CAUD|nr:MAG TPA: hypothetical protein [Siphoviridae sp. ctsus30]DAF95841.1 MAG TPA: hypothetical protein [Siphoviridae sp. ctKGQ3]